MKIGGIDPTTLPVEVFLVLPRGDQEIVFRARPVPSMDEFEALCPRPTPPGKMTRDGWVPMPDDPTYQQLMSAWSQSRLGYMIVKSLEPSSVEWDTVNLCRSPDLEELVHGPARRRPERHRVPAGDEPRAGGQLLG